MRPTLTIRWVWDDRPIIARLWIRQRLITIVDKSRWRYHTLRWRKAG